MDPLEMLDKTQYLYLRKVFEPRDNQVTIIVDQGTVGDSSPPMVQGPFSLYGGIGINAECKAFELQWKNYCAYLVTDESVGSCGDFKDEVYTGTRFREYSKSHFLQHLARDTGAHLKPIRHFKLICLNHLVDVAAVELPEIRIIPPRVD